MDSELLLIGKCLLKNKREVWINQYLLTPIWKAARELLTLELNDPRIFFEGQTIIDRMMRIGVLGKDEKEFDYFQIEDFKLLFMLMLLLKVFIKQELLFSKKKLH